MDCLALATTLGFAWKAIPAGNSQHGQVVGTVAHSNSLRNIHFLHLSYQTQQLRLTLTVDYITEITAGQFAILYFQLVGIHIVYTVLLLEVLPEVGETLPERIAIL